MKTLGGRLTWAMQQCGGIGAGALAFITGTDKGTISRLAADVTKHPRAETVMGMAPALGQDPTWLWMGVGQPKEYKALPPFPEGRARYGDAYREAFRTLWRKSHVPIPDALAVTVRFHERDKVTADHIVRLVREAARKKKSTTEVSPDEFR